MSSEQRDRDTERVILALADLAPRGRPRTDRDHIDAPLVWLQSNGEPLYSEEPYAGVDVGNSEAARQAAALDRMNPQERLLSVGWAWAVGTIPDGGRPRRVATPLLSIPVRIRGHVISFRAEPAGDPELTPFVTDRAVAHKLEASAQFGGGALNTGASDALIRRLPRLQRWVTDVASAAGFPSPRLTAGWLNPLDHVDDASFIVVLGYGLFRSRPGNADDIATTLRAWPVNGVGSTAFAEIYWPQASDVAEDHSRSMSTQPLTVAQARAVVRCRTAPVSVVSGAPGNGKTHAAVAAALDAVARGEHVLVATRSFFAAEVIAEQLHRHPGPTPIVFGSSERRQALARELSAGTGTGPDEELVRSHRASFEAAASDVDALRGAAEQLLTAEHDAERARGEMAIAGFDRIEMPELFSAGADLNEFIRLVELARSEGKGWLARRRRNQAEAELRHLSGAGPSHSVSEISDAIGVARRSRAASALARQSNVDVDELLQGLVGADERLRDATGLVLADRADAARCRGGGERRAVAALARALRAGRSARRDLLAQLSATRLLHSLPLWVGTLGDIDDLLPPVPALFDLVILDEASQIDQIQAAPALLRGRRALVVGDPQQLRHVSFVGDDDVRAAVETAGLEPMMDRLDIRRSSAFDTAAAVATVEWLDAHHRSVPHLIEFSAERFYPDRIQVVTRHPRNECLDAVDLAHVDGRNDGNVNKGEIESIIGMLRDFATAGTSSVGVITPFRPQADALEAEVVERFSLAQIDRLDLRVSTVHGFQGDERAIIILSLVVDDESLGSGRRFIEDPHLFNVMITRARERVIVVTSLKGAVHGLIGDYLAHADRAPAPIATGKAHDAWTRELGAELERSGLVVRSSHPVGEWNIDLCVGKEEGASGIFASVHEDGPAAHVRRYSELSGVGWRLLHALPTWWDGDAARAAVELHPLLATSSVP